ncbi:ArnT family glycosyltransferase [Rhizobium sp. Root708]|uniref:ArnT family glycosyltransferase n=1 Tax=Rhizobium sp. Root708 TaxID=1736592 RepID=UPI000B2EBA71|nr:glycosyltransferase family 39 protein [Rhizobium sp. Root708]
MKDAALRIARANRVGTILWLLVAIAVCLKVMPDIVRQSFFFDGLIYASIARNLAEGIGTVWEPQFSKALFPVFAEHPPLMMWLQSLLFRVFGDTIVVEKCFSLATFGISLCIMALIWDRLSGRNSAMRRSLPLALVLTVVAGRFSWAFANGMLENLLIVFTSLAVLLVVVAYDDRHSVSAIRRMSFVALAGLATALALMAKGPVGLFPLATPGLYWLCLQRPRIADAIVDSVLLIAVVAVVFCLLWSFEGPRGTIERYVSIQLLTSLSGERGHAGGGLSALRTFVRVLAYPLVAALVISVIGFFSRGAASANTGRREAVRGALFLAAVGCSASLPLFVSPRVSGFYFNPSLPYFSGALAIACAPVLLRLLDECSERALRWAQSVLAGAFVLSCLYVGMEIGRPGDDADVIENAGKIATQVCDANNCHDVISTCGSVGQDWRLHGYLERYYKIALDSASAAGPDYLLASSNCQGDLAAYSDTGVDVSPNRLLKR